MVGPGRRGADGGGTDDAAAGRERFAGIRAAAGEALGEMRRLVDLLEAERDSLPRLLESGARAAGLHVHATRAAPRPDARRHRLAVVQEGLTNAVKHAPGADVDIAAGETDVTIRDHGARTAPTLAATGAGLGLAACASASRRRAAARGRAGAGAAGRYGRRSRVPLRGR